MPSVWVIRLIDELQQLPASDDLRRSLGLPADKTVLAVLPGSREAEVRHLMPVFASVMNLLHQRHSDLHFVIPAANGSAARANSISAATHGSACQPRSWPGS